MDRIKNSSDPEFPITIRMNGEEFPIPSDSLGKPMEIGVLKSNIVLYDPDQEFTYKLIDVNSKKIIKRFGRIGRGPGEFATPTLLEILSQENGYVGIYDRKVFMFHEISIDSVVQNKSYVRASYGPFNTNYSMLIKLDSSSFIGTGVFEKRYAISDLDAEVKNYVSDYPFREYHKNIPIENIAFANQGIIKRHPESKRFVLAYFRSPNFEISTATENDSLKVNGIYISPPIFKPQLGNGLANVYDDKNIKGFNDVAVTKNFIYLLYSGRSIEQNGESSEESNTIWIYDWEGRPIKRIELDQTIQYIAVDEADKILYGVKTKGQPKIYSFSLLSNR